MVVVFIAVRACGSPEKGVFALHLLPLVTVTLTRFLCRRTLKVAFTTTLSGPSAAAIAV
jgi:hypothetical protein